MCCSDYVRTKMLCWPAVQNNRGRVSRKSEDRSRRRERQCCKGVRDEKGAVVVWKCNEEGM